MLEFTEYTIGPELAYRVTITLSAGLGHRQVCDLRKEPFTPHYWVEFSDICLTVEEVEEILNKVKELNNENQ